MDIFIQFLFIYSNIKCIHRTLLIPSVICTIKWLKILIINIFKFLRIKNFFKTQTDFSQFAQCSSMYWFSC